MVPFDVPVFALVPFLALGIAVRRMMWDARAKKKAQHVFKGKVVWITGASSGIGKALALKFAEAGAKLVLSARRESELKAVAEECANLVRGKTGEADTLVAKILPFDLAEDPSTSLLKKGALAAQLWGGDHVDVLVNNGLRGDHVLSAAVVSDFTGGISSRSPCEDTSLAVDLKLMAVDYIAPVALTKSVLPSMLSRRSGHIVVVSSVQGRLAIPFRTSYGGAKHALHGFFESLRAEVADRGVKVTLVLPGYVRTSLSLNAVTGSGQAYAKMDATTAKGMDPAELATKILEAVAMEQDEVLACDLKTKAAIAARALLPGTLSKYMASRAKEGWKELKANPPAT